MQEIEENITLQEIIQPRANQKTVNNLLEFEEGVIVMC